MSSYRTAPKPPPTVVVRLKRSLVLALVMLSFVAGGWIVTFMFSRSVLTCSRASNTCELLVLKGPDLLREPHTFELSGLKRAVIDEYVDNDGDRISRIALEVNDAKIAVVSSSSMYKKDKTEWAERVNRFLQDASQQEFEIGYGSTWPSYIIAFFTVLLIVGYLRARTEFVVNPVHRVFRIQDRVFGSSVKELPLDEISAAFIDQKVDDENTEVSAVALRRTDGTIHALTGYSNVEHNDKVQLVAKINDALETTRKT